MEAALRSRHADALHLLVGRPFREVDDPVLDAHEMMRGLALLTEGTERVRDARGALERVRTRGLGDDEIAHAKDAFERALEMAPVDDHEGYARGGDRAEEECADRTARADGFDSHALPPIRAAEGAGWRIRSARNRDARRCSAR